MRQAALSLVVLVLAPLLAGCTGDDDAKLAIALPPALPLGLLLTYDIQQGTTVSRETFVVVPDASFVRYDLLPYRVTRPGFDSPFLHLGRQLTPRDANWTDLLTFPLEEGAVYPAKAGGVPVSVTVEPVDEVKGDWGTSPALAATAVPAGGVPVARIELSVGSDGPPAVPVLITSITASTPDGTREKWRLVDWDLDPLWNHPPLWEIGDWWTYRAFTDPVGGDLTLVFNANKTGTGGSAMAILNSQDIEDRLVARPFHTVRRVDLASQSGEFTNWLSKQWDWPLADGKRWRGSTNVEGEEIVYEAAVALAPDVLMPDGTYTTAFNIRARTEGETEPFATWDYAPAVHFFTRLHLRQPGTGTEVLNWTLLASGREFFGTMDIPKSTQLFKTSVVSGPRYLEKTFSVNDTIQSIEVKGTAVRGAEASMDVLIQVLGPDGTVRYERNAQDFGGKQVMSLVEAIPAGPGEWRFEARLPDGTSFFTEILGRWTREQEYDYRNAPASD